MIVAFTGAGISKASGIPTFAEQDGIRDKLERNYAIYHPQDYQKVIDNMKETCDLAKPNNAHIALAEYNVPILTMNVDGLHQKAGSEHIIELHGRLPNIVLYGDSAPEYSHAMTMVVQMDSRDILLIIGVSFYTSISDILRGMAIGYGAKVDLINRNSEKEVRTYLENHKDYLGDYNEFMHRNFYD